MRIRLYILLLALPVVTLHAQLTPPAMMWPVDGVKTNHTGDVDIDGNLAITGSMTATNLYDRREIVDPVFLLPNHAGVSWTDFEFKASSNNFTAMHYWYHSPDPTGTNVTAQVWDVRPAVYFTDSRLADRRMWIRQNDQDSIYDMLVDPANSYVGGWLVYVRGLGLTRSELEDWVWSYMLMDGANTEDDPAGRSIWRIASPARYVPAGTEPNL